MTVVNLGYPNWPAHRPAEQVGGKRRPGAHRPAVGQGAKGIISKRIRIENRVAHVLEQPAVDLVLPASGGDIDHATPRTAIFAGTTPCHDLILGDRLP